MYPQYRKRICLFGALLCGAAAEARASTDNYVEVQIASSVLGTVLQRSFTGNSDFCPEAIPCPWSPSTSCVVDHLTIGSVGSWSRASAWTNTAINSFTNLQTHKVLYTQPLTVHVKTMSCAQSLSCTTTTNYSVTAVYELYMNSTSELCIRNYGTTGLPAGATAPETDLCLGIELDEMLALSGFASGDQTGSALSLKSNGSRIAARFEFGRSQAQYTQARIDAWQTFINGTLNDNGNTGEWSTFIHQSLIRDALASKIEDSMNAVPGLNFTSGISTGWWPDGANGGTTSLTFDAVLTDTPCPNDIDISDIHIEADTGINAAHDGLYSNGFIGWNISDWDVFACGMAFGGPVGAVVFAGIAGSFDVDLTNLGDGCSATGDTTFACDQKTHPVTVAIGPGQSAKFSLAGTFGSIFGLTLTGPIALTGSQTLNADVYFEEPSLSMSGGCYDPKTCQYRGGLSVTGNARLCNVDFWNDPQNIFDIEYPSSYSMPAHFSTTVATNLTTAQVNAYNAAPYGLKATVWTSLGVKTYQSPPMTILSDSQETMMCGAMKVDSKVACMKTRGEWPWEKVYWGWYPDYWLDPVREVAVEVMVSRRVLDYGIVTDFRLEVLRDSTGLATSIVIHATAYPGVGNDQYIEQPLAISVAVPRNIGGYNNAEVVKRLWGNGYRGTVALNMALAPPSAAGATFALSLSQSQLQAALH